MVEFCLAVVGAALVLAVRWRDHEVFGDADVVSRARRRRAAAGRALRVLLVPALLGAAAFDWRPTVARHASDDWLIARAADESSRFREPALLELIGRMDRREIGDETIARIVRDLWTVAICHEENGFAPGEVVCSVALYAPSLSTGSLEKIEGGRSFGSVECRVVSASFDGGAAEPCAGAPIQSLTVKPVARSIAATTVLPVRAKASTADGFRCELALAYRAADGRLVGPEWRRAFAQGEGN